MKRVPENDFGLLLCQRDKIRKMVEAHSWAMPIFAIPGNAAPENVSRLRTIDKDPSIGRFLAQNEVKWERFILVGMDWLIEHFPDIAATVAFGAFLLLEGDYDGEFFR